jgi:hypothetical protein
MNLLVSYHRRSSIVAGPKTLAISLEPNLRRDRVSYTGLLRHPIRFREAMSALHDVVVSDLRYKPRDKSAYRAYLAELQKRESEIRHSARDQVRTELHQQIEENLSPDLEQRYDKLRKTYWNARDKYARLLAREDPTLWRLLMPCDPVITVAGDVLFFECFSADESSYGCLSVDRDAFASEQDVAIGTTNVDYSWNLYEHFQQLRSYRETRFQIDPAGFTVATQDSAGHHEEKIDLPSSWLRGFMQMQAVQSLPVKRVPVSREALYSILAYLKRHRASKSPRAVRFELEPGKPIQIVLEPWEQRITLHETRYEGHRTSAIRTWGRDRLRLLARLLPIMDRAEVCLLGTGMPSFWIVYLGEMRFTLGLSGWTANDWTAANSLDQLMPPAEPSNALLGDIARTFQTQPAQSFEQIRQKTGAAAPYAVAGLNRLALFGQLIHDLPANVYRWRQIMPVQLSLEQVGPDNPETVAARTLISQRRVRVLKDEKRPDGLRIIEGKVEGNEKSLLLDADGRMLRGQCNCSHHFKSGVRRGPCRHLQALRNTALNVQAPSSLERWYDIFFMELWN